MYLLFLPKQKNMLWLKSVQLSLKENTKTKPLFSKSIMISRNVKLLYVYPLHSEKCRTDGLKNLMSLTSSKLAINSWKLFKIMNYLESFLFPSPIHITNWQE